MSKMTVTADAKPMLNAYPDSVGGTLSDITGFLQKPELKDVFSSFYILPSVFNTDLEPYDKYYRFDGELQQFTVLTINSGNQVTPNSTYIQSLKDAIMFLHKFNGAKFSNVMPYDEIVRIFKDGIQKNGVSLGVPDVLISLIISELCRDSENDFQPFRFKANKTGKDEGYSLIGIKKIPQKSSVLAALAFEDMQTAIRAAVHQTRTDFEQRTAPIEKLIFS